MTRDLAASSPRIEALERALVERPQVELRVEHAFFPGLYVRTLHIPAGVMATSKIHRTEHPFVVTAGAILVFGEREGPRLIEAPYYGRTMPGDRRAGYALSDTVWTSFHATHLTDPDEIEREIILPHVPGFPPAPEALP